MRRLPPLGSPTALLATLLALVLAACGDEGATSAPARDAPGPTADPTPTAPHPIAFVKGLAAGIEAAADPDALLFVYLGRHHPT